MSHRLALIHQTRLSKNFHMDPDSAALVQHRADGASQRKNKNLPKRILYSSNFSVEKLKLRLELKIAQMG